MGRGRAKAKQTKVARDLKYQTHETDFGALARELHGGEEPVADLVVVGQDRRLVRPLVQPGLGPVGLQTVAAEQRGGDPVVGRGLVEPD